MTLPVRSHPSWREGLLATVVGAGPDDEKLFEAQRAALENRDHFLHDMSVIDAKSSALLTHVSIMLAVVAVFLGQQNGVLWKWVFTVELAAFSVVAVFLLRCVDILGPPFRRLPIGAEASIEGVYRDEVLWRRAIFQGMVRAVRLLTVALIAAVFIKALV
ncbi:MAG: hypothetical protein ABJE47_06890 [bacterium]